MIPIRELKRRYRTNLALGRALPTTDLAIPLPLSTGNPLFDAALVEKLARTTTLSEPEHVARVWHLVKHAPRSDLDLLARNARGLLNDAKLLLALRAWQDEDDARVRELLATLPWSWRLSFPTAVIKPAAVLFTGWRRSLRFRLVDPPRFPALRALYRELLSNASGIVVQKYRARIQEATALLKYRFAGERERAIHDVCYGKGEAAAGDASLEPIGTTVRARNALRSGGPRALLAELDRSEYLVPITTYMGMLGSAGLRLTGDAGREHPGLCDYAVRCASIVESLLRLEEWSPWLEARHAEELSQRVRHAVIEGGFELPFFKVVKAFNAAPTGVRKLVLEPLLLPLLRHFGTRATRLLPPPGPFTFAQPGNVIHVMSFMLYSVLASAMPSRLLLLLPKGAREAEPVTLDEVGAHLADGRAELQQWLLKRFGGLATHTSYTYDYPAIARAIGKLDPAAPVVLDLPFVENMDVLQALRPFERVFNLSGAYGAPGEVSIAYEYYLSFFAGGRGWHIGIWERWSDKAAERFTELVDRLQHFQSLAAETPAPTPEDVP